MVNTIKDIFYADYPKLERRLPRNVLGDVIYPITRWMTEFPLNIQLVFMPEH